MRFGHYFQNNSENRNKKTGYIDFLGHTLFKFDEMRLNSVSTVKARFFVIVVLFFVFVYLFIYFLLSYIVFFPLALFPFFLLLVVSLFLAGFCDSHISYTIYKYNKRKSLLFFYFNFHFLLLFINILTNGRCSIRRVTVNADL